MERHRIVSESVFTQVHHYIKKKKKMKVKETKQSRATTKVTPKTTTNIKKINKQTKN